MKRQKGAQIVQFPQHHLVFPPEEIAELSDALRQAGLLDFIQYAAISETCKSHIETLKTQDSAVLKKGMDTLLADLETYRRGILVLAKQPSQRGEAWLVALASMAARLLACSTVMFDLIGRLPDAPGETSPSLGKALQDGLNLFNKTLDQVFADAETEGNIHV